MEVAYGSSVPAMGSRESVAECGGIHGGWEDAQRGAG